MPLLSLFWSEVVDAPALAFVVLIALAFAMAAIVTLLEVRREARRTRITMAAARRIDAYTPERRHRLRALQGGRGERNAS